MLKKQSTAFAIINTFFWKFGIQIFSILKHILIAGYIGLSIQLDIFYMALAIFGIFITSWMLVFDNVAIPKLVEYSTNNDWCNFKSLGSSLLGFSFILSIFFVLIVLFLPNHVSFLALGFSMEEKDHLARNFIWLFPAILLYLPLGVLYSILKSVRQFSIFNKCEFIGSISILIFLFFFLYTEGVLYWSYSLGISLSFIISFYFVFKKFSILPKSPFENNLRSIVRAMPPLLIIHSSYYLFVMTDRFLVTFLNPGDIAALTYATVITYSMPQLLSLATYFLTAYSEEKKTIEKNRKFNEAISLVLLIGFPTTVIFISTGDNIISILLERGVFSSDNSERVTYILSVLCFSIIPLCIQPALDQIYQAEKKLRRIIIIKCISLIFNVFLSAYLIFILHFGVIGAALGTTITYWFMLFMCLFDINYFKIKILWMKHFKWLAWLVIFNSPILVKSFSNVSIVDLKIFDLFINIFLIITLTFFSVFTYLGQEKILFNRTISKFFSTKHD
tara:strand:+ start:74 stop:1585 length:1512 start_codon:yes stop_codon:yes gene_type:complete